MGKMKRKRRLMNKLMRGTAIQQAAKRRQKLAQGEASAASEPWDLVL
jgi:hypothetical protein